MKNAHLIAACGVGMASLAGMLREKGFRVTGSDANVYPPMSTQLETLGIRLSSPYAAENIPADAELVQLVDAYAKLDGNMDRLTDAMTLMGQFCASCRK